MSSKNAAIVSRARALAAAFGDESGACGVSRRRCWILQASIADRARRRWRRSCGSATRSFPLLLRQLLSDEQLRGRGAARPCRLRRCRDARRNPGDISAASGRSKSATPSPRSPRAVLRKSSYWRAERSGRFPPGDITADLARQIKNLGNEEITARLTEVWGNVGDTSADAKAEIARWTATINSRPDKEPDPSHGRAVFAKTCQQCHTLFGEGGKVGPDLTGSNRANLEYVLSNMLTPAP